MSENKQELFEKLSPDSVIKLLTEGVQSKSTIDEVADYVRKTWDTVPVKPMW